MEDSYHFQVNLGGMLDILSNHLYKTSDVFLRELMQNGVDAVTLRKKLDAFWQDGRIVIEVKKGKQLFFQDNGAGLTQEEIHRFLAVIGQSSKSELADGRVPTDFIGRFGIGLLSCFMVSDSIEVHTRSVSDGRAHIWKGYADGTYTLEPLEDFSNIGREELFSLGQALFDEDFLEVIPIQTQHLSGVAYIVGYPTDVSVKKGHRIHLKNMLLTEEGSPLLPEWAFFMRCFLNTDNLRPTASRENFYEDEELALAQQEFSQEIQNFFAMLARRRPEKLQQIVHIHHTAMKSMAIWNDEIFRLVIDYLPFVTSEGEMNGKALKEAGEAVIIDDVERFKQLKPIFIARGKLLICTGYSFDSQLIRKMVEYYQLPLTPVQEESMELLLDDISFEEKQEAFYTLQEINKSLAEYDCKAELKRFYPVDLPALYYISDDVAFLRQVQNASEQSKGIFSETLTSLLSGVNERPLATLYLNRNSPLVCRLLQVKNNRRLESVAKVLYVHAMVTGGHTLHRRELQMLSKELLYLIDEETASE